MNAMLNIKGDIATISDEEIISRTRDAHRLCVKASDQCETLELCDRLERALLNYREATKSD